MPTYRVKVEVETRKVETTLYEVTVIANDEASATALVDNEWDADNLYGADTRFVTKEVRSWEDDDDGFYDNQTIIETALISDDPPSDRLEDYYPVKGRPEDFGYQQPSLLPTRPGRAG